MSQDRYKVEILSARQKLFGVAKQILENEQDAEDAVQEVLLKIWLMKDTLWSYDNLTAFAFTVTRNHCLDCLKARKQLDELDQKAEMEAAPDNPYLQTERKNTVEILQKIIENLPPLQQMIIQMKDMQEFETEEIAQITGTTAEAIRMNLSRARKKVRDEFLKITGI